ncbi:hypothetical protein [Microbacterium oxydans]|uniref:hypothetical protein n=1 Tax=Microbacterium oxydans TaxID=82380 RepID=UPI0024AE6BCE|nr:hypothetical protein [Microbacterium oxydans]
MDNIRAARLRSALVTVGLVAVGVLTGCTGSAPAPVADLPEIDPSIVIRGADGFGTYPTLADEVVCHTVNGRLTTWQTPRTYDWDKGGAGGALAGDRNHDIRASELPDLFAQHISGTSKAYDDRIEFYAYRLDGNNAYSTKSKDATITLNGTLHCTVFIDENGSETSAVVGPSSAPAPPTPATINSPAQVATECYQSQGRGDYAATCDVIDPQSVPANTRESCAAGWRALYEGELADAELSAFLRTYVVAEEGTTITGDTATVVVAPGPHWTHTTTLSLVKRGDRWYVDPTLGF